LEAGVSALQHQVPASAGRAAVSPEAFEKLASTTHAMQRSISSLTEQMQTSGGKGGEPQFECMHASMWRCIPLPAQFKTPSGSRWRF